MPPQLSREQLLEKYRDVIGAEDFELLVADSFPTPDELQREGSWLQFLGPFEGCWVYLKRTISGTVTVVVFFGAFASGVEKLCDAVPIAYDAIGSVVQAALERSDSPADKYAIAYPKEYALAWQPTTTTTTTTTTPPAGPPDLPIGSGVLPYSDRWGVST